MTRTIDVIKHDREYAPGKHTTVKHHKRTINDDLYDPLSEEVVDKLSTAHLTKTSPDAMSTSRITFLKGNKLWAMTPGKYDILNFDAPNVPEYDKVPEKALPNQIIRVGAKYYLGDKNGKFKRTFPPRLIQTRYAKFKEEYLKTHDYIPYKGVIWEAYRKHVMNEKLTQISRRDWERMKEQQGLSTYHASRENLRVARKAGKDINLMPMPGWHTIRTVGYGTESKLLKKGGVPFAVYNEKAKRYDNYYTWPGKKERERMIKEGLIKA